MNNLEQDIKDWLHNQQDWLQAAAECLLKNEVITEEKIAELVELIKSPEGEKITSNRVFEELVSAESTNPELRLLSIDNIHGIENLAPKKPLIFGKHNLTVIYGNNGSGKSSYSKLIKNIAGKPRSVRIKYNIFKPLPESQSCDISYQISSQTYQKKWYVGDNPIDDIKGVDIFDNDEALYYLNKESSAIYTPKLVSLFESLAKVCDDVKSYIQSEQSSLISTLPTIPETYKVTEYGQYYNSLKYNISDAELNEKLIWSENDDKNLSLINERLKETNPAVKAKQLRATKIQVESFIKKIQDASISYSKNNQSYIEQLRSNAEKNRKIANECIFSSQGNLQGIGSESWKAMWEAARVYFLSFYPEQKFPVLNNSVCVFCHQELSTDAQNRLQGFEHFVQGSLESTARECESLYSLALENLSSIPTDEEIETQCEAALLNDDWKLFAKNFWESVKEIRSILLSKSPLNQPKDLVSFTENEIILQEYCSKLDGNAHQFEQDAKLFDRDQIEKEKLNLEAKKWIYQQLEQVKKEISRLNKFKQYEQWINSLNSRPISNKAGAIAEEIITTEYINRFNKELTYLGATHLKVELIKTKSQKGKSFHGLKLKSDIHQYSVDSILSEGERRIISLAAFLADVMGKPYIVPFIFDDPISSLDQIWEEKTIERLVSLSQTRQVIIFTHRLSMLGLLSENNDKINTIHIRQESWGVGEPGDVPLYGKKPDSALKDLFNNKVTQARKAYTELGQDSYYPLAKAICSDLRILIERIVESVFLADVIQRHRRAVNTKGKIDKLAKICINDCRFVEEIMTKYSRYEHSQSLEAPVLLPTPEELSSDIERILMWHQEFITRTI